MYRFYWDFLFDLGGFTFYSPCECVGAYVQIDIWILLHTNSIQAIAFHFQYAFAFNLIACHFLYCEISVVTLFF
jgi:hypothetical protein